MSARDCGGPALTVFFSAACPALTQQAGSDKFAVQACHMRSDFCGFLSNGSWRAVLSRGMCWASIPAATLPTLVCTYGVSAAGAR